MWMGVEHFPKPPNGWDGIHVHQIAPNSVIACIFIQQSLIFTCLPFFQLFLRLENGNCG